MVILIDDKKSRQLDYGWNPQRFDEFKEKILPIRTYDFLENDYSFLLQEGNTILLHESFFNDIDDEHKALANCFSNIIEDYAKKKQIQVAYFSGSKTSRKIDGNIAYLPVYVMYEHLQQYLLNSPNEDGSINYLLWGNNPLIEKELHKKISDANNSMVSEEYSEEGCNSNVLVIIANGDDDLDNPINDATVATIFLDTSLNDPVSDAFLDSFVNEWLCDRVYDAVLLPLCFGPILSDYNGLRLAMHIRCTKTKNQCTPIFIYSPIGAEQLIENEYFDVLKTRDVSLIGYSNNAICNSVRSVSSMLDDYSVGSELKKVRLSAPKNYLDSHSVANEWAIYRWAEAIGASDKDISKLNDNVKTNLYFKYLNTISPVSSLGKLTKNDLKIKSAVPPKVLLVDDEAEKGWYEVFCEIIEDVNGFPFCHLDDEFNNKSCDEIVRMTLEKIKNEDIDIVLLDFRLHKSDFVTKNTKEITGYKILERVKEYNAGVQVVVVSATNKIWNWEELREAGADGFILKESPSVYQSSNTIEIIKGFVDSVQKCCDRLFLKKFYADLESLKSNYLPRKNKKHAKPLDKNFVEETMTWFELSCSALKKDNSEASITSAFLFLFSVLENMSNRIIRVDSPETDYDMNGNEIDKYKFQNGDCLKSFDENYEKTTFDLTYPRGKAIAWKQKILNTLDYISVGHNNAEISLLVSKRNDFIHKNSTSGHKSEIELVDVEKLHEIVYGGLINMK